MVTRRLSYLQTVFMISQCCRLETFSKNGKTTYLKIIHQNKNGYAKTQNGFNLILDYNSNVLNSHPVFR